MQHAKLASIALTSLALVIAGCGSSSKPASKGTSTPAAAAVPVAVKHDKKLGTILAAGPSRLTVYLFEADKNGMPTCTGACAATWPAVVGTPSAIAGVRSAELGTVTRADGTKQVTYAGHPLYTYAKDHDSGDAYGQALKSFGAEWYTLAPSGNKVDKS